MGNQILLPSQIGIVQLLIWPCHVFCYCSISSLFASFSIIISHPTERIKHLQKANTEEKTGIELWGGFTICKFLRIATFIYQLYPIDQK